MAFYGSGQLDTEASYLAGKLFKGSIGTNNTDSNSRLCMAAAVAGYRTSLGSDGPPTCYADIDSERLPDRLGQQHGRSASGHLRPDQGAGARPTRRVELIVVDPRRTATAAHADAPRAGRPRRRHPLDERRGLAPARARTPSTAISSRCTPPASTNTAGFLSRRRLGRAGRRLRRLPRALITRLGRPDRRAWALLSFYCMGLNQSTVGMWKNNSLINLHLLTGQIGKAGAGPFSLTGQPNAMGGREAGLLSHQLPGLSLRRGRASIATRSSGTGSRPAGTIASRPGLTAVEMFRALETGQLKAIWIAATNPAVSLPDLHHVRRALAQAELVVVQDAYHPTETSRLADVLLPAAQWGEKTWTSTSSERLVSL